MKLRLMNFCLAITMFVITAKSQSPFPVGADWLNPGDTDINYVLSSTDWSNIVDLGLNWGLVAHQNASEIADELANAETHGVNLITAHYKLDDACVGLRWQYDPEWGSHFPFSGRTGIAVADPAANFYPDGSPSLSTPRTWKTEEGAHSSGYMANGLLANNEQPDGITYFVKVRMKIAAPTPYGHTPVVTVSAVRLSDGTFKESTIFADQFSGTSYQEISVFNFLKSTTGPLNATSEEEYLASIQPGSEPSSHHKRGSEPSAPVIITGNSIDYRVYWHGQITCYLDYVAIDDNASNLTHTGGNDAMIDSEVDLFKNSSSQARYFIWDEADPEWFGKFHSIGYVEQRIKSKMAAIGKAEKTGWHWNVGDWAPATVREQMVGRDIAWTKHFQTICDPYPISGSTLLSIDPDYTQNFQDRIQAALVSVLRIHINSANKFGVPFWYTPQAHSWHKKSQPYPWLREPTATELRLVTTLGLAHGAKGIIYFMYYSQDVSDFVSLALTNFDGSPRRTSSSGTGDKWATVKSVNQRLAGSLGQSLLGLTWQKAFSIHEGQPADTYISSVSIPNSPSETKYVELSLFKHAVTNADYFMAVNRRTMNGEYRAMSLTFNHNSSGQLAIVNVENNLATIISPTGSFSTGIVAPGDCRLFRIDLSPSPPVLSASYEYGSPFLQWTSNDTDIHHYQIWRSINTEGGPPDGFSIIADNVTETQYTDWDLAGPYGSWAVYYKIKAVDNYNLVSDFSNQVLTHAAGMAKTKRDAQQPNRKVMPTSWDLLPNYPNPFNPTTIIRVSVPDERYARVEVFNSLGQSVAMPFTGVLSVGYHEIPFDAKGLPSGTYICRIHAGTFSASRKMILSK